MSHTRFLQGYYLGTPVFIIADLAFNAPIRVSFVESSINLLLLILSVMIPIYNVAEAAAVGGEIVVPYTAYTMINVLICGSVLVLTFHRSEAAIMSAKGGRRF